MDLDVLDCLLIVDARQMADPDDTGVIAYPAFVRKLLSDAQIALKMPPPESEEDKKKGAKKK